MWRGSLRNPDGPVGARWDWGWLSDCFGATKISLSDVDAALYAVERKGAILWIEVKRPSERIPYGQMRLLTAFATKPQCSAMIVWGDPDDPHEAQWILHGVAGERQAVTRDDVHDAIAYWFDTANQ